MIYDADITAQLAKVLLRGGVRACFCVAYSCQAMRKAQVILCVLPSIFTMYGADITAKAARDTAAEQQNTKKPPAENCGRQTAF